MVAVALALWAPPVTAEDSPAPQSAAAYLERGLELFAEKSYEAAIEAFLAGFELEPRPEFLFAAAQAERLSGDCRSALVYYRRYLELGPGDAQTGAAEVQIDRCERALSSAPGGEVDESPIEESDDSALAEPAAPPAAPLPPPSPPPPSPWYRDPWGGGFLLVGVAGAGAGGFFWSESRAAIDDASLADSYDDYVGDIDSAVRMRNRAWVGAGVGAAALAAAALRFATREPESRVELQPAAGGATLGFSTRF